MAAGQSKSAVAYTATQRATEEPPLPKKPRGPKARLGLVPTPTCDADLDLGLSELAYMRAWASVMNGAVKHQIDKLTSRAEATFFVTVEGTQVSFADRRMMIEQAVEAYVKQHRAELFAADCKTKQLTHGSLSFTAGKLGVRLLNGETDKTVVEKIGLLSRLSTKLTTFLDTIRLFGQPVKRFLRHKQEIDRVEVLKQFNEKSVDNTQLGQLGLNVSVGPETLAIALNDYDLKQQSKEERE